VSSDLDRAFDMKVIRWQEPRIFRYSTICYFIHGKYFLGWKIHL